MPLYVKVLTQAHYGYYLQNLHGRPELTDPMKHTIETKPELYLIGNTLPGARVHLMDIFGDEIEHGLSCPAEHREMNEQYKLLNRIEASAYLKSLEARAEQDIVTLKAFIEQLAQKRDNCARVRKKFID